VLSFLLNITDMNKSETNKTQDICYSTWLWFYFVLDCKTNPSSWCRPICFILKLLTTQLSKSYGYWNYFCHEEHSTHSSPRKNSCASISWESDRRMRIACKFSYLVELIKYFNFYYFTVNLSSSIYWRHRLATWTIFGSFGYGSNVASFVLSISYCSDCSSSVDSVSSSETSTSSMESTAELSSLTNNSRTDSGNPIL